MRSATTISDVPIGYGPVPATRTGIGDILTVGFLGAVGMWAFGFWLRLPGPGVPSAVLFTVFIGWLVVAGMLFGRYSGRPVWQAAFAGLVAGLLNLLILGSLLSTNVPNQLRGEAPWWILGTLAACTALVTIGAVLSRSQFGWWRSSMNWPQSFAIVACLATIVLISVGGLVTSADAGLAVVDWPNSFGYNMFLYPLSRMTGGIYYEHSHRLLGSLVGLTTVVMAIYLSVVDTRRWLKLLVWAAAVIVAVQGLLGGLRVTGKLTLSTSPEETAPNLMLAFVHGVLAQVFFCLLLTIAMALSRHWPRSANIATHRDSRQTAHTGASTAADRWLCWALLAILVVQLVLGAATRHFTAASQAQADIQQVAHAGPNWAGGALIGHIALAVVAAVVALFVAGRLQAIQPPGSLPASIGGALLLLVGMQLALGLGALLTTIGRDVNSQPGMFAVLIPTLHQTNGALVLGASALAAIWSLRFRASPRTDYDPESLEAAVVQTEMN